VHNGNSAHDGGGSAPVSQTKMGELIN
jgi:hypothetical protein